MNIRPFHHQRPLAAFAAAYGVGIGAGVFFAFRLWYCLLGLMLSAAAVLLLYKTGKKIIPGMMALAVFLGMLLAGMAENPILPAAQNYQVQGVLSQDIQLREDGSAAGYLEKVRLWDETGAEYFLKKVYWTYTPDEEVPFLPEEGDQVSFSGYLYHPGERDNPYGFDFRMFLLQKGVAAGISGAKEPLLTGHPGRGFYSLFYHTRKFLQTRFQMIFGEQSILPETLLLGERENLPEETKSSFSKAGVAHLLSVSGLHVGLLAWALMLMLRRLLSPKKRSYVLGIFLLIYCGMLEFSAPVVRASILLMLGQARRTVRRANDSLTTLSAAFLLILFFRPLDLFSLGFQLSFGAVLGIFCLGPRLEKALSFIRMWEIREGMSVTLAATAGIVLPTIQGFHYFPLIGILVNPLACAIFGMLLPAYALVAIIGCFFLTAGQYLAVPVNFLGEMIITAIEAVGDLPYATIRVPYFPWYLVIAIVFSLALCTRYILWSRRKRIVAGLLSLLISVGVWQGTICRDVQYIQFSMGQQDAAMILDGKETVLIDAGEYGGDLAGYLLSTGRNADHVIITHLHSDHFLGIRELMEEEIAIGKIYLPIQAEEMIIDLECYDLLMEIKEKGIPITYLSAGDHLLTRRTDIEIVWPVAGTMIPFQDANRYPLCMLIRLDGVTLFSASDLEGAYECYAARDADILKVSHHGSNKSTGEEFLRMVSPRAAILTASPISRSLPHKDLLSRLAQFDISVYNTGERGAVMIRCREGKAEITTYLKD